MSSHSPRKVALVGSRIRELRKGRRLTQTELSEKIGVAQSDLSRMEQGEYKVGLDTLFKILQVFDLKMGEFFGETETPAERDSRDLVAEFQMLSEEARQEVRDFVRFKKLQEAAPEASADGEAGEHETAPEGEEKP
ncbi:MAG TPA: helix-turn-helix transcriptional regulator [Thermoanaerobaculia bacterium]|nr:helix-turn-helix transcriptional regulator [Thermoanaerobaculia bacterium]